MSLHKEAIVVGRDAAAELLSISVRTLDDLVKRGEVPSFKIGERRLFSVDALRQWAMRQGVA